jgi:ParB-like chromosome segregation protein Spo0J
MIDFRIAEVSARSPDMSTREFDEFVDDIRTNGQLVPIWKLGDEVIDGRKRLAACERLGITPMFVNMDPSQDRERVARALNILRTHYSQTQRAIFAAGRATAKEGRPEKLPKLGEFQPVTVRQAADEAGVAASSVSRARQILKWSTR